MNITTHDTQGRERTRPFTLVSRTTDGRLGVTMLRPGGRSLANVRATGELKVDGRPMKVVGVQEADVVFAKSAAAFVAGVIEGIK